MTARLSADRAAREVFYRGFDLKIDATLDEGVVWIDARLSGGPERVDRSIRFMALQADPEAACIHAESEFLQVVDDLLLETAATC